MNIEMNSYYYLAGSRKFQHSAGPESQSAEPDMLQTTREFMEARHWSWVPIRQVPGPQGRPGSHLPPGVADVDCGPEAEKRGFWRAWRRREGGGKPAQSRSRPRVTCIIDIQVVVLKARKNQGKPACQRSRIEWEIGKLRLRENRVRPVNRIF